MTKTATSLRRIAAAIVLGTVGLTGSQASAQSLAVQLACASDYYAYCSQHSPTSSGVRTCMRANGLRLSGRCVNALISAGEVSRSEVERRRAEAK